MILSHPDSIEGSVTTLKDFSPLELPSGEVAILCRQNSPLMSLAVARFRAQLPVRFLKNNFFSQLQSTIRDGKTTIVKDLLSYLSQEKEKQVRFALAKANEAAANKAQDFFNCLEELCSGCSYVQEVTIRLNALVSDQNLSAPVCSTIHGAKGLEWDNVIILNPELMPSPWAGTKEELQQECNLQYVAVTRARQNLFYASMKIS